MSLELQILLPAFLACLLLTGLFSYLGIHVLAREVIFVDIALAQIAALGTAVGSYFGVEPHTPMSYVWSLGFTFCGAALFALTRGVRKRVPQEAFIGITYAVSAAVAILVANVLPHGDEEIKEILVGSLLTVSFKEVGVMAGLFAVLGVFHFFMRKRFLALSFEHHGAEDDNLKTMMWDLLCYMSFGIAIASSVQTAGVLLVFSFLIVPAVVSALFTKSLSKRLALAWGMGALVSVGGLFASFHFDLPTGAAVVATFGAALLLASGVRWAMTKREKSAGRVPVTAGAQPDNSAGA